MGRALVILIGFVYNPLSIVKDQVTIDPRYDVLSRVTEELRRRGHGVMILTEGRAAYKRRKPYLRLRDREFGEYSADETDAPRTPLKVDCAVLWWATLEQGRLPSKPNAPTVVYENGFARGDVVVDPRGLLGGSFYVRTLNDRARAEYDADECATFLAKGHRSKRPQPNETTFMTTMYDVDERQFEASGGYVFVPTQKTRDLSVAKYSNTSMFGLLAATAAVCRKRKLPLVIKIHPHVDDEERARQVRFVERKIRPTHAETYLSTASIDGLVRRALLTVTLNGGTIVDNLYTETPVLTAALSLFAHTDAVLYDPNVTRGLETALDAELPWSDERRLRQRQVVCWLAKRSLNVDKSVDENIDVLQTHLRELDASLDLSPVDDGPTFESHPLPEELWYKSAPFSEEKKKKTMTTTMDATSNTTLRRLLSPRR